jgi:type VI protein secretion system component Hcp
MNPRGVAALPYEPSEAYPQQAGELPPGEAKPRRSPESWPRVEVGQDAISSRRSILTKTDPPRSKLRGFLAKTGEATVHGATQTRFIRGIEAPRHQLLTGSVEKGDAMRRVLVLVVIWVALIAMSAPAAENFQILIKLPGIEGEATFGGEPGWITLTRVKVGPFDDETGEIAEPLLDAQLTQIEGPSAADMATLDVTPLSYACTKEVDKSTPKLGSVWQGDRAFPEALVYIVDSGDDQNVLYRIQLTDVRMLGYGQTTTMEHIALAAASIRVD